MIPTFEMKKAFFDRQKVIKAVDRQTRRSLSRSLSFVRRTARRDVLRRRKRTSSPGSPPSIHSKNPTASLRTIFFVYDQRTKSGVVGPVKLNQSNITNTGSKTIPQVMEEGGPVRIPEEQWKGSQDGKWFRRDGRRGMRPGKRYRVRTATYKPRPFMAEALRRETEKGNIASPWANVVTG